ncbi:MAG: PAS domain S-box protein [Chitinophagaceae bacterium]|nr:MAG: PAS domain S-box protein [Chitinophagaceae bacterium]
MKVVPESKGEGKKRSYFPVVAIGASAGGIEALTDFLKHLPADTGISFIYIQHLSPEHESNLAQVLSRSSEIPVLEAKEGIKLKPNHLYIIPPNRSMTLSGDVLRLSLRPVRPKTHSPINEFFISLADAHKERAIGVLLSGNPPDGTLGLKAIKSAGGITFAQDSSAQFSGMAKNAIAEEAVDFVLSPHRIAEEVTKLASHQDKYQAVLQELNEETIPDRDENLANILRHVHRLTGVDFSHYKLSTIKRRIVRRMIIHKIDTLGDYVRFLRQHINEGQQLYQDLLINVTNFFREGDYYEYLKKSLLPKMLAAKAPSEPIRIWVAACSTGQEAYSLAMILVEVLGESAAGNTVQIFATDLSENAINKARLGIYSKDEVADIPPRRLNKFFTKIDGSYRIIRSIRDLCVFATHNVLKDPPFSKVDMVSCCNLLIYLEPVLQKKVMGTFHYALCNTGYLMLGKSETIGNAGSLFSQVDKKYKIYAKKKDAAAKAIFELTFPNTESIRGFKPAIVPKTKTEEYGMDKVIDDLLLKKYTPPCVVVNQDLEISQFRGSTGLFLEPTPGKASLNLLKMARPGLAFELRTIVLKASKSGEAEKKSWEESGKNNQVKVISIEAVPIKYDTDTIEKHFLLVFDEQILDAKQVSSPSNTSKDKRVKQLEDELAALREDMRSVLEEQEAAHEELQSVNEEIISSNEELQSINEELETSKEELESSNEELLTINQELQMRNEQLAEIQEYSEAVFTTIRESLLILDKNLRIKNANSTFYKTFHMTEEETEGKLLYDLGNGQWNIPKLKELLEDIIPRNSQVMDFEVSNTFPYIGEKVMVVNGRRLVRKLHSEHLILLAIEDITEHRRAQKIIADREEWFHNMANHSPMMLWVINPDKKMEFVNDAYLEYRDLSREEVIGQNWQESMHPEDEDRVQKIFDNCFSRKKEFETEYRIKKGNTYKVLLTKGKPNYAADGKFIGFIGSCVELPPRNNEAAG